MVKQFLKTYWTDIILAIAVLALMYVMPQIKTLIDGRNQQIINLSGWSKAQVIVAPDLPCTNCKNTIFQLHQVDSTNKVTAVCCLCGVSHVEIDCRDNSAICGLERIFKRDSSKFELNLTDGGYVPGHIYYEHRQKKQ